MRSVKTRIGAQIVHQVSEPAEVEWDTLIESAEIEQGNDSGKPGDNGDIFGHSVESMPGDVDDPHECRNYVEQSGRGYHRIELDRTATKMLDDEYKWYRANGASKQVAFERRAMQLRNTLDRITSWYRDQWQYVGVIVSYGDDYTESLWGIDDEDYARDEIIPELCHQLADAMELDGYTILNRPNLATNAGVNKQWKRDRIKTNVNRFNVDGR